MKLAVDARFLTQGMSGVQRYAHELCRELDEALAEEAITPGTRPEVRDLEVTLLSPRLTTAGPAYRHLQLREVGRTRGHLWEQLELPRHARSHDVLFCPGNVAPLATLRGRSATVVTVHDLAFRYHPETVSWQFRRLYEAVVPAVMRCATKVVTVSESERARMLEHFPSAADRLVAVSNGSSAGRPAQPGEQLSPPPPAAPFILYVGALNERKNVSGTAAAVLSLLAERPDLHAVFVGAGAGAYAEVELGLSHPRIHLTGAVDDATLAAHYREAALMLFPSFHEASGLPPVEAMSHGCPVVVSDIPALRERCGDAAAYCDPHDVTSIKLTAARVLDDHDLRRQLIRRGTERSAAVTWRRCFEDTLSVIRSAAPTTR